jgi:twinkle protein
LSLDFAEQGVNTLWGSFEIKNTRLLHKLLQQFSREPLPVGKPEMLDSLNALADRFETLPLHFMKFHGGSDVDDVLDAMDFAAYVYDVEHVILDNMQFMISRNTSGGSKFDKFDVQDGAIEKFRKFATDRNVHVTLVVHPRKEDEGARLGISSIYGSAKATQEADLVLILQNEGLNEGKRKYIEVKKNRFDGELGNTPLFFERSSGRYVESPEADLSKQTRATPVPTRVQAGTTTIRARMPQAAASPSDSEIDNHWHSMLEDTDEK